MVEQVARDHVLNGGEHGLDTTGEAAIPILHHLLDGLTLQVLLRAAQVARNDGEGFDVGVADQILLFAVGQRADHHVLAIVAHQLGRHGLELATVEHVEEQGLEDVVAVVAKGNLGATQLLGGAVENTAAQP